MLDQAICQLQDSRTLMERGGAMPISERMKKIILAAKKTAARRKARKEQEEKEKQQRSVPEGSKPSPKQP